MFRRGLYGASSYGRTLFENSLRRIGNSSNQSKLLFGSVGAISTYAYLKPSQSTSNDSNNPFVSKLSDKHDHNNEPNSFNNVLQTFGKNWNVRSILNEFYDVNNDDEIIKYARKIVDDAQINFQNCTILDLNIHNGAFAPIMVDKMGKNNVKTISLDISDSSSINSLPSNLKNKVDVIILSNAFHYLDNAEDILKTINKYLKPKGKLIVIDIKEGHFHLPSFIENIMNEYELSNNNQKLSKEEKYLLNKGKHAEDHKVNQINNVKQHKAQMKSATIIEDQKHNPTKISIEDQKHNQTKNKSKPQNESGFKQQISDLISKIEKDGSNIDTNLMNKIKQALESISDNDNNISNQDSGTTNIDPLMKMMKEQMKSLISLIKKETKIPKNVLNQIDSNINAMMDKIQNFIKDDKKNIKDIVVLIQEEIKNLMSTLDKDVKDSKMLNQVKEMINKSMNTIMDQFNTKDDNNDNDNNNNGNTIMKTIQSRIGLNKMLDSIKDDNDNIDMDKMMDEFMNEMNNLISNGKLAGEEMNNKFNEMIQNLFNNLNIKDNDTYAQFEEQINDFLSNVTDKDNKEMINQIQQNLKKTMQSFLQTDHSNEMNAMCEQMKEWIKEHISSFDSAQCKKKIESNGFVFEKNIMSNDLETHFVYVFKKK